MKVTAKYRISLFAVFLLCVACVVLSTALFQALQMANQSPAENQPEVLSNFDAFSQTFNRQFQNDRQRVFEMLDGFFDDDYFTRANDPFKEMEKRHQELMDQMEQNLKGVFNASWNAWFDNRFTNSTFITEQKEETRDAYIYRFAFPDLKGLKLNVKVDDQGITIEGEYIQQIEKTNEKNIVIAQHEIHRSIYEHISIPDNVDAKRSEVNKKGNEISVRLPKRISS